jgi:alkylated DNA nucleotide flippase Atl1
MPNSQLPLIRFLRKASVLIADYADDLDRADPEDELSDDGLATVLPEEEHNLGKRQRQIVGVSGIESEGGVKTSDIARAIDYEVPNTYTTLQALARQGVIEQIPGKEPQHWRLARRYRANSEAFMRLAALVKKGEFTTYGDISIAVLGSTRAARGVGRAAAKLPEFPNPHRVLMEGGRINEHWVDDQARGPEECRRRLEAEGVMFPDEVHADAAARVTWDELMRRDAEESLDS